MQDAIPSVYWVQMRILAIIMKKLLNDVTLGLFITVLSHEKFGVFYEYCPI